MQNNKIEQRLSQQIGALSLQCTKNSLMIEDLVAASRAKDERIADLEAKLAAATAPVELAKKGGATIAIAGGGGGNAGDGTVPASGGGGHASQ